MLAIKNAKIITMNGEVIEKGDILISEGKILDVGSNLEIPKDCNIVDKTDKIILPGFVDAHTHLGIGEEDIGWAGKDYDESTDPVTPHLKAIDAINPADTGLKDAYKGGVTTVMVTPGSSNIFGGECCVIKTHGKIVDDMVLKENVGIKAAVGENPKRDYGSKQNKAPKTRMGIAAIMRKTLLEAQEYKSKKESSNDFEKDIKLEALLPVLNKEIPLKVHAHRADDIITVLRIKNEFDINVTIEHCTEGHLVPKKIYEENIPAIVGPTFGERSKNELKNKSFKTAGILADYGVKVAIMSDHGVTPTQYLPIYAALSIKAGMDEIEALKSITINPAEILGVDDRVGSIEKGKDADLIVFKGDPLDIRSEIEEVYINGKQVK